MFGRVRRASVIEVEELQPRPPASILRPPRPPDPVYYECLEKRVERRAEELMEGQESELLHFNIGGKHFEGTTGRIQIKGVDFNPLLWSLRDCECRKNELSLLRRFAQSSRDERTLLTDREMGTATDPVYFFDRNAAAFAAVVDYYRTGNLHIPVTLCVDSFVAELASWELSPGLLSGCCMRRLLGAKAAAPDSLVLSIQGPEDPLHPATADPTLPNGQPSQPLPLSDMFTGAKLESMRRRVWIFLEDAQSSSSAKMFSIVSVSFVLLSVVALVVGSLPECQDDEGEPHISLIILEYIVIGWFTFEYVVRLIITTQKWAYIKSPLVIIDMIAIAPFYVEILLWLCGVTNANLSNIKGALLIMRVLRVLRVVRILRLARYSNGMKSCGETLRASYREVGMLVIFVCTMITMFSTTVYFMERDVEGTRFISIPATFWWCIVTITTVGYGDMVPMTFGGRLVASLTSVCGVIVLAFPITVIVENFYRYYRKEKASGASTTSTTPKEPHAPKAHGYGMV